MSTQCDECNVIIEALEAECAARLREIERLVRSLKLSEAVCESCYFSSGDDGKWLEYGFDEDALDAWRKARKAKK